MTAVDPGRRIFGSLWLATSIAVNLAVAGAVAPLRADEPPAEAVPAETVPAETVAADAESPEQPGPAVTGGAASVPLPPSFERLRPIQFFQGQGSGVIPESFRPIAIPQLDQRLSALGAGTISVFEKPQLTRSVYVARLVDTALVSSQTTWEISHAGDQPVRFGLGKIGLALQSTAISAASSSGFRTDPIAIVTEPDGTASVAVHGDTKLTLAWTAAGQETEREIAFDLGFPRAEQARWLIEVPQGMRLQALDGVSQTLPSPPPEAGARDSGRGSWYAIEAGGLDRLRLRVLKVAGGLGETEVIIRQASLQYELSAAVIKFTCRLSIDPPVDGVLPTLQISGGRVTAISVGGAAVAWNESTAAGGRMVRIRQDRNELATNVPVTILVDGEAAWDSQSDLQPLPWLRLRDSIPIVIGNQIQAKVAVDSRLTLLRLETPSGWRYLSAVENDERRTTYRLGGPWDAGPPLVGAVHGQGQAFAESLLRLSATESRFRATWESSVALASLGPQPIRLRVDAGWTAESVMLPLSGRAVDLPADFATRREIVIWPTTDELADGNLKIRVTGSRPFRIEGDWARYPATSFITFAAGRNRFAALVTPPAGFRWDAEASLQNNRIGLDKLTPIQRELVDTLPTDALLLDITQGRIMALGSRRPAAAFNVSSLSTLAWANDSVIETHTIKCESASGELDQIRVEFSGGNTADVEWSVSERSAPTRRLIRAKRVSGSVTDDSTDQAAEPPSDAARSAAGAIDLMPREIWDLELERSGSRGVVVVGRRQPTPVDSGGVVRLELPTVLGANNRLAQVFVPATFAVLRTGEGVIKVPRLVGPDLVSGTVPVETPAGTVLRYDSSVTNWIEVARAPADSPFSVIWHETVRVIASGRGGDWVTATYALDSGSILSIRHDPDMRLASVSDAGGAKLPHETRGGQVWVPLDESTRTVVIRWSRPAAAFEPMQRWRVPSIEAAGVVLGRDWRLVAAPDTWIPQTLWGVVGWLPPGAVAGDSLASPAEPGASIEPLGADRLWLVDRSMALGAIAIVGFLLFAFAWMLAVQHGVVVGACFVISVALAVVLPVGWIYWVAAVCVPLAAGGLVGSTLAAMRRDQVALESSPATDSRSRLSNRWRRKDSQAKTEGSAHKRFHSVATTERIVGWLLVLGLPWGVPSLAHAQTTNSAAIGNRVADPARRPIVLVPTKTDGTLAGDKVYISQAFFNDLFRERSISVAPPLITSAVYRLRLDGMTESGMPTADWEIRYSLANLAERSEIRLPLKGAQVRGVQWLPGGEAKPLRWTADGEDWIRVSLPPTSAAAMLVRLSTDVQAPERLLRRIALTIPAVTAASLVVDSGTAVQRFELSGAIGQTIAQPETGRLSADLGASSAIDLTVTLRQGARGIPAIAARRYWIHGSGDRCQVECEVDPATESVRRGTDLPIVILGGQPPILTSRNWVIQAAEMISPQRQLLTCRALRDSAGPIRLLWNLETTVAQDEADAPLAAFAIPEVISAGSAATPDAQIALQASDGYRWIPIGLSADAISQSADAIDAFVSQWGGFRDTASQILRSPSPLVRLAIAPRRTQAWTSNERHHLHVRQGEMRLTLDAVISRGPQAVGPLRLAFPRRVELRELTINGVAVSVSPHAIAGRSEVAIPEPVGTDKLNLRVVAHQRLGTDEAFSPPRIRVVPIQSVTGTYTLTRDQGLRVEQIRATDLPELDAPALDIADQLISGYFPCWTWRIAESDTGDRPSPEPAITLDGSFRAEQRASRVDSVQRTAIRWTQSRWMLDVLVQVRARGAEGTSPSLLDDLSIELPTAWSDQLMVEPAEAWSSQPAIDPAMKVIRIRPDEASRAAGVATLRLQAFRIGDSDSLLEVPTVRIMGAASTQTFLSVPPTASGRPLIWQTQSAVAESLPAGLETDEAASAGELVFRALSNRAVVRLQPSRPDVAVASATLCDIQLFPQPDANHLAIVRWDVEPGDAKSLQVDVPDGVVPLAVWVAGRGVPRETLAGEAPSESGWTVPVMLSQLAQPIVMLCQLRSPDEPLSTALPTLRGVDVRETWLALYQPLADSDSPPRLSWNPRPQAAGPNAEPQEQERLERVWTATTAQDRLLALAQSVIDVTESSISGATDRPQEELVAWLTDWDQRFVQLRSDPPGLPRDLSSLLSFNAFSTPGTLMPLDATLPPTDAGFVAALLDADPAGPWPPLVDRWRDYVRRVTGVALVQDLAQVPALVPSNQWTLAAVARHDGTATTLPVVQLAGDASRWRLAVSLLLAGGLVIGGAMLFWAIRGWVAKPLAQPAVWLLAVGMASIAITPIPVAVAICVVAITAPLLNVVPGRNSGKTQVTTNRSNPKPLVRS